MVAGFDQIDPIDLDLDRWRQAGVTALDALEAAQTDPGSPLFGALDLSRLAVVGHSYGGSTTLSLAATDPRVKVAVALTPGCEWSHREALLQRVAQIRVPTLIVGGEIDPFAPVRFYARALFDQVQAGERLYVELARTEHTAVSDYALVYPWFNLPSGGWVLTMPAAKVRRLSRNYANAWLEHHLGVRADTQGYVDGQTAAAELAAGDLSRVQR